MNHIRTYQVDVFTDKPFAGNPAAVCLLDGAIADSLMQQIAMEMNLSETAFLMREGEGFRPGWHRPGWISALAVVIFLQKRYNRCGLRFFGGLSCH